MRRLVDDERGYTFVENIPGTPYDTLDFAPVPEPKTVKNRIHLDVTTPDVDALVAAGATVLRAQDERSAGPCSPTPTATSSARSSSPADAGATEPHRPPVGRCGSARPVRLLHLGAQHPDHADHEGQHHPDQRAGEPAGPTARRSCSPRRTAAAATVPRSIHGAASCSARPQARDDRERDRQDEEGHDRGRGVQEQQAEGEALQDAADLQQRRTWRSRRARCAPRRRRRRRPAWPARRTSWRARSRRARRSARRAPWRPAPGRAPASA